MQLYFSAITEKVIQLIRIPVFREGNVLHLAQATLEVVETCSGLRLFALLNAALVWFGTCATRKKWVLFLAATSFISVADLLPLFPLIL